MGTALRLVPKAMHASCNRVMGQARDNPRVLRALAEYLEKPR